jgi:DNA-binding response OmpR family regulator/signal recognition particle receptor subunit beta
MDDSKILVADADPKNIEILRESLETSGFNVVTALNGLDVWEKLHTDHPDLILSEVNLPKMDGFELLERMRDDPQVSSIPLLFLTNRRDIQDRVRSLRGGVKDYMIKPLHVKEVVARIKMILRRMQRIRAEEIEASRKLVGRLEEFSVIDLVESFGVERKTGVLTVNNENNRTGEIYFRNGSVVNATLGNFRGEKAVYQMLPWDKGHFTMTFKEVDVPDEITVSNLGLLLEGFKRIEKRQMLLEQLPNPDTRFVMTETFRKVLAKKEVTTDVARFVGLFDGRRTVLQIVDESTYEDLKALERIVRLYNQGFIRPVEAEPETVRAAEPPPQEEAVYHEEEAAQAEAEQVEIATEEIAEEAAEEELTATAVSPGEQVMTEPDVTAVPEEVLPASPEEPAEAEAVKPEIEEPTVPREEEMAVEELAEEEPEPDGEAAVPEAEKAEAALEPVPIPIELRGIVRKLAQQVGHSTGSLVVLAPDDAGRERFIQQFSGGRFVSKRLPESDTQHVEVAHLLVTDDVRVELFGISTECQFTRFIDTLVPRLLGTIVLLDVGSPHLFSYLGYLVRSLYDSFPTRFAVAVTNTSRAEALSLDYIRDAAGIPNIVPMNYCDLDSTISIVDIVELLLTPETMPSPMEGGIEEHRHAPVDSANNNSS